MALELGAPVLAGRGRGHATSGWTTLMPSGVESRANTGGLPRQRGPVACVPRKTARKRPAASIRQGRKTPGEYDPAFGGFRSTTAVNG